MKTVLKGIIITLLLATAAYAQKAPIKFGDVPIEDLKMTVYDKDSSASAVVLADYGESFLSYNQEKGFVLNHERITRIKILTKDGLKWADRFIYVYNQGDNEEKVTSLKGVTYNLENGKVVETKLKNESIFKEKQSENVDVMKVAFTNVKEGSIIELSYKILSDFIFNFQDWEFQESIPVRISEYRARVPEYFQYDKYMQGYITLATVEETTAPNSITITSKERSDRGNVSQTQFYSDKIDFQEKRYRWVAKDVPAFKEEPHMTTYRDYISKINFELSYAKFPNSPIKNYTTTWADINKLYAESESFGREVTGNGFLKKTVEEITAGMLSPEEKIAALHNYVRNNFLWDGSTRSFVSGSLRKVVDEKKGNSGELNLLLASMIEKTGIQVLPVLISTRDHGFLREHIPATNQFNNVICVARFDGKQILLDGTEKLLPVGFLPERCLNGKGFAVAKEGHQWIDLKAPAKSRKTTSIELTLSPTGEFTGTIKQDLSGYYGVKERKAYLSKGEADYVKDFKEENWEITKSEFQNLKELQAPFKEIYTVEIHDHVTMGGNTMYFNPLFKWQMNENPFKLEKREYPVDYGSAFDEMTMTKINLPAGYAIEEAPQSKIFVLPDNAGKLLFNVNVTDQIISITSSLQINRSLFTQEEYENLREFYARIVAKHAEQVVLKKI